ncbi:MAG: YigZ family protein [Firmicutes bacterium]|nr:YigZ family protein [Bacillota bacterium]
MKLYRTVLKEAAAEQIIQKSRFICYVRPVSTREEADEFIASVRKEHREATHNVPAMVIGDKMQIQWSSDDSEPQGTAGAPVMKLLTSMELTNVCVVVTRYFGGIKLGTGGLARAYSSTAKLGLDEAGIGAAYEMSVISYAMDYSSYGRLQKTQNLFFDTEGADFGENVTVELSCDTEREGETLAFLEDVTGGKGKLLKIDKKILTKPES